MTKIIAVAKATKNVLTSTDPNDFIFHSSYNTFKIKAEGILSNQTVNAEPTTFTVVHNQLSIPGVFAFAEFPDGYIALPTEFDFSFTSTIYWEVEIDSTNISFLFYKGASADYNVNIKYYIFEVPAT